MADDDSSLSSAHKRTAHQPAPDFNPEDFKKLADGAKGLVGKAVAKIKSWKFW